MTTPTTDAPPPAVIFSLDEPDRNPDYTSEWVLDRKVWRGTTWILRYTKCGRCSTCSGDGKHGPYWCSLLPSPDNRNRHKQFPVKRDRFGRLLGPWGKNVPPSLPPSDLDPNSRRSKQRAIRAAIEAERAKTREKRELERAKVKAQRERERDARQAAREAARAARHAKAGAAATA